MIEVENISKRYGSFLAVDSVSFKVNPGEIVAFVGPNGAGKSTALKMLSTYLAPDSGVLRVNGIDVVKSPLAVRRRIGYMPENNILYESMRVDKFLKFVGEARGLRGARLKERIAWVVENCQIDAVISKRIHQCSKGYHRRVSLAMSLIHDPGTLLLDEPTHGLDPLQVLTLRDFIVSLKSDKAILFSSHIFQEVIAICDRVMIINNGLLLGNGTVEEVARAAGQLPPLACHVAAPSAEFRKALEKLDSGRIVHFEEKGANAALAELQILNEKLRRDIDVLVRDRNWTLLSMAVKPIDLERLFAEMVRKSNEERASA